MSLVNQSHANIRLDLKERILRYGDGTKPVVESVSLSHALDQSHSALPSARMVALRDDGHLLVTNDGELADLSSRKVRHTPLAQYQPADVAFSPDGSYLAATGDGSGWVGLWDGHARRRLGELPVDSADTLLTDDDRTGGHLEVISFGVFDRLQMWGSLSGLCRMSCGSCSS
ncbi:hypothetical protein, partial [Streptomyces griseochromogenes]|uniref:hypothetical protein n=1 Tax=Streptomyces griseochromogenes TaxID=68214 RepID=UPI00378B6C4D